MDGPEANEVEPAFIWILSDPVGWPARLAKLVNMAESWFDLNTTDQAGGTSFNTLDGINRTV
jgi:hypothetical protein